MHYSYLHALLLHSFVLYNLLKSAGQADDYGMTYRSVKELSLQLNQCALYPHVTI